VAGTLRWGIAGTGKIARTLADAIAATPGGELVAVGSRDVVRASAFADQFGASKHGTYDEVLGAEDVDVIYVAAEHPMHRSLAVAAADGGKHVLCEKPLAVNARDAAAIVAAARRSDVLLVEAFAYRSHPQTARLLDLLRSGRIGGVRSIDATFGYDAGRSTKNYLFSHELAGGGILDVGCYPTSMSHLVAATMAGSPAVDAIEVTAAGDIGAEGVDLSASATLNFPGDVVARVGTAIDANLPNVVVIEGELGRIRVVSPWLPGRIGTKALIQVEPSEGEVEVIEVSLAADLYTIEVDAVQAAIDRGERSTAMMPWEDSLANMRTLDRWRAAIGLRFPDDDAAETGG
jgi:predicted dehydrogenase